MEFHLYLTRHGDAQVPAFNQSDQDRELTTRGLSEANEAGKWLRNQDAIPELILSSNATRTFQTAVTIATQLSLNPESICLYSDLYLAPAEKIMIKLAGLESHIKVVLVVGHNPGISDLINLLSGTYRGNVPTGSTHHLLFDMTDWSEIYHSVATGNFNNY